MSLHFKQAITSAYHRSELLPVKGNGDRHQSYTLEKGYFHRSSVVRYLWCLGLASTALLLLMQFRSISFLSLSHIDPSIKLSPTQPPSAHLEDTFYTDELVDFIRTNPIKNGQGKAFAQMGLQSRIYAHFLDVLKAQGQVKDVDQREKDLWFFVPGIKTIRQRFLNAANNGDNLKRGIVLSVHKDAFTYACHFLATLRHVHKSSLPVEVFHYGAKDLTKSMREHLSTTYNVTTIDLETLGFFDEKMVNLNQGGYAVKVFAMLASSFDEVLMADADTILLASPESFFRQDGYQKHGTLFFQDRLTSEKQDEGHTFLAEQLGTQGPSKKLRHTPFWIEHLRHSQESGVVLLDKSRSSVLASLLFIAWQNTDSIRSSTSYKFYHGDKETYWMAFEIARFPYYMVSRPCGVLGAERAEHYKGFCGDHPLHFFDGQDGKGITDPVDKSRRLGQPAWFNGSLRNNKYHDKSALLNVSTTIWAADGSWEFHEQENTWCLSNYTRQDLRHYGMDRTLSALIDAGNEAQIQSNATVAES